MAPSSAARKKGDGTVYSWKYYRDQVFEIIFQRHSSASMIMAVDDYYGNDVINEKGGEHQNHSAKHFPGIKKFNRFF